MLKGDAVACFDRTQLRGRHLGDVLALYPDHARVGALQAQDTPEQYGLAGAGSPDDAEHLILMNLHVERFVHDLRAEAVDESVNLEDGVPQMSSSMKSTAKIASARMTRKMACTTATVVSRPSCRDEPRTCMPL